MSDSINLGSVKDIISHIRKINDTDYEIQANENHSHGVAELAKSFADEFGMGDFGYMMGMLHDKGKEKIEFQEYIQDINGIPNHTKWTQKGKQHAYVGALIAKELFGLMQSPLLLNPLAGHHRGLYNDWELRENMKKDIPQDVSVSAIDNKLILPQWFRGDRMKPKDFHHIVRQLFSCLVDADYLDTERFMKPEVFALRGNKVSLLELMPKLDSYLQSLKENVTPSEVNKIRNCIQQYCIDSACAEQGIFSLTVPTGGGKTLSSLVWAMRHAATHNLRRIIIAIPYTSIIVQTARVLKDIFGEENVLEHHSNLNPANIKDEELREQTMMAMENWDYPIIVTTNVQLLESMMGSRSSDCRKLHNICNSVLILDEVQTLPTDFLQPIVDSLDTYQRIFGVSILLTTASQPILSGLIEGCNPSTSFLGIGNIVEIIPPDLRLHDRLRRVLLSLDEESSNYDEIAERLRKHDRVLCIVNTRCDAKEIFDRLPDEGITLHLSRMMCPKHVSEVIAEIRKSIETKENKIVRVVATQLIEAGVDIDFPVVYRQEAGLDSVLQAAGRCNREGERGMCTTYVFSLTKEHQLPPGSMRAGNEARKTLSADSDWFAPETMTEYFQQLYCRTQTFDCKGMHEYLYNPRDIQYEEAAQEFKLINDNSIPVIVNWNDSPSLVDMLRHEGPSYSLMKQIAQYSVNVRSNDLKKLLSAGTLEEVIEGTYYANEHAQYSEKVGLLTENHWLEEILII